MKTTQLCEFAESITRKGVFHQEIGWALREYSYHEPERVRDFVGENKGSLSGLSLREATKVLDKRQKVGS